MLLSNSIKTVLLLSGLSGLLLLIGYLIGGTSGITIALFFAIGMNFFAYFYSDKLVLRLYKAKKLDPATYDWVYTQVKELAHTMKIPMPKLWLVENPMANAFATGRNPKNASVAVTTGILSLLTQRELRGVLAHELSHVKNRDILVGSIAATLATAIGYVAQMLQMSAIFGSSDRGRRNPLSLLVIVLLMPLAATLMQLAISRSREYLADETGAECTDDPEALAAALEKLVHNIPNAHLNNEPATASTASLFIVHPFLKHSWTELFSTHPPLRDRIMRLRQMYEKMS